MLMHPSWQCCSTWWHSSFPLLLQAGLPLSLWTSHQFSTVWLAIGATKILALFKEKNQISDCGEWPFPCTRGKLLSRGGESITSGMGLSQIFTVTWCCVYKHSQWLPSNISCQSRQWQSEQKYVPCSPAIPAVKIYHQGTEKLALVWWGWGGTGPTTPLSIALTQVCLCLLGLGKTYLFTSEPHVPSESSTNVVLCKRMGRKRQFFSRIQQQFLQPTGQETHRIFPDVCCSFIFCLNQGVAQQRGIQDLAWKDSTALRDREWIGPESKGPTEAPWPSGGCSSALLNLWEGKQPWRLAMA